MVTTPVLNPLTWNVPIVNKEGRPTKEFQIKWQQLSLAAQSIPSLSTPAAVSAVLDILSGGAVNGSLLVRSGGSWQGYPSPSNAAKFLAGTNPPTWADVDDADLALSDVLTNNVSTSKHGFAPKLPNDATKYLDGTGAYSVPPSGAGLHPMFYPPVFDPGTPAGFGGNAYSGIPIIVESNLLVTGMKCFPLTGADQLAFGIYNEAFASGLQNATLISQSVLQAQVNGAINTLALPAPVTLTPGTTWWVGIWVKGAGNTFARITALPVQFFAAAGAALPSPAPASTAADTFNASWWLY